MIRESGWLVFLALLAFVVALVYIFAGTGIRYGMIYSLEKSIGAEVNIDDVSLGLFPFSIEVERLQITDRSQPTHNLVSFDSARGGLEVWPALLGYYVIDELSIDGLATKQKRESEGDVYEQWYDEGAEEIDLESMLQLDLPSSDDLIARANLQTEAKGLELQKQAKQQKQELESLISNLPTRDTLDKIQADIKALVDSDIENAADLAAKAQQLKILKEELQAERDNLRAVQDQLSASRESLASSLAELRAASVSDWHQLQSLANISDGGLAPISEILLGDIWGERISYLEGLYRIVGPYLPDDLAAIIAGQGSDISEAEAAIPNRILPLPNQPYPDFWIKRANINWLIGGGEANLEMADITGQHSIIDAVTQFDLDVSGLPNLISFSLDGDFSIFDDMITNMSWDMDGLSLSDFDIGAGENAFKLASGLLVSSGSLKLVNHEINQQADVLIKDALFGDTTNKVISQLLALLNEQAEIPFSLGAIGDITNPDIYVRSNLDSLIGDALLGGAKEKISKLQTELRADIETKLQQQLGGQSEWLATLDQQDGEAAAIDERIKGMMDSKLGSVKDEIKDRLKEGLFKALGG